MSFVSGLREELVAAAERERARRVPRLALPARPALVAATAAAALALIVAIAASSLTPAPDGERPAGPEPTPDARPLFGGSLAPGVRYETRAFVPALSFAVADDGWAVIDTTQTDALELTHGDPLFDPAGERRPPPSLTFARITDVYDPVMRGLAGSLTPAPADLYGWLSAHPDLRVGTPEPVTVAGAAGQRFDVEARFRRPAHADPECRRRYQVTCTAIAPGVSLQDGTLLRVTVLTVAPGPLVIAAQDFTRAGLRDLVEAAAPVLDSLRIGVR